MKEKNFYETLDTSSELFSRSIASRQPKIVSNLVHKSFGLLCRVFSNYRNEMNADKYQLLNTSNKGALLSLKWSFHRR
jgi:hypothetical protein